MSLKKTLFYSIISLLFFNFVGCKAVKPYHQGRLNHPNIKLQNSVCENATAKSRAYREGNSGSISSGSSGGCGCN